MKQDEVKGRKTANQERVNGEKKDLQNRMISMNREKRK